MTEAERTSSDSRWPLLRTLAACFLPGALAGTQLAGLLFFLNPHLPFETRPVGRAALFYGTLLGTAGLPVLLLLCRGQRKVSRRLLPTWLTAVLLVAAVAFWSHAYYFGYFLPPGINRRLLKAAIWLTIAALVCFYTIVLHRLRHRSYGLRSRLLFGAMALVSIYVVMERREAFRPDPKPPPRPTTITSAGRPQLLVVGVDSATLEAVLPLAEQGRLPFLSRSLETGAYGRLEALEPVRHTPLWTTLATGLLPYRHGLVGERTYEGFFLGHDPDELGEAGAGSDLRMLPVGLGFDRWGTLGTGRPVDRRQIQGLPLWEALSRLGLSTAVVSWPATSPPTLDVSFILTDRFFDHGAEPDQVSPGQIAQRARLFETEVADLDPALTARFGPSPDAEVLIQLGRDLWRRDVAFYLLDQEPVDALFLHLPGLGVLSRAHYGGFESVRFQGSNDVDSAESARWIAAYYATLDAFLAQLWGAMRTPRQLVLMSSHGIHGPEGIDELNRVIFRRPARRGYFSDGPDGLLLLRGEGFRAGAVLDRAQLVDPMPTLFYGLGLPVARDLDGTVLTEAFDPSFLARQPLSFVPSYETFSPRR